MLAHGRLRQVCVLPDVEQKRFTQVRSTRAVQYLGQRAVGDDSPALEQINPITQKLSFVHEMRRK